MQKGDTVKIYRPHIHKGKRELYAAGKIISIDGLNQRADIKLFRGGIVVKPFSEIYRA